VSKLRSIIPVLSLAAAVGGAFAYANAATPAASDTTIGAAANPWAGKRHHGHSEFRHVLHQLNLTADQQTQIRSVFAQAKPQLQTLAANIRQNRDALAATAPTDPAYPNLLATANANAAARIQAANNIKTQIYAILTPAQVAQIPGIVAADQAARAARIAAWRAAHTPT
jgi:protein CpxP